MVERWSPKPKTGVRASLPLRTDGKQSMLAILFYVHSKIRIFCAKIREEQYGFVIIPMNIIPRQNFAGIIHIILRYFVYIFVH